MLLHMHNFVHVATYIELIHFLVVFKENTTVQK
jgi:hypothetical protein